MVFETHEKWGSSHCQSQWTPCTITEQLKEGNHKLGARSSVEKSHLPTFRKSKEQQTKEHFWRITWQGWVSCGAGASVWQSRRGRQVCILTPSPPTHRTCPSVDLHSALASATHVTILSRYHRNNHIYACSFSFNSDMQVLVKFFTIKFLNFVSVGLCWPWFQSLCCPNTRTSIPRPKHHCHKQWRKMDLHYTLIFCDTCTAEYKTDSENPQFCNQNAFSYRLFNDIQFL